MTNAMTAREMLPAIGQRVSIRMESLNVVCDVLDAKYSYGRPRILITPVNGTGQQWVELSRVSSLSQRTDNAALAS